jgi:hypothetical protein
MSARVRILGGGLLVAAWLLGCGPADTPPPRPSWDGELEREAASLEARLSATPAATPGAESGEEPGADSGGRAGGEAAAVVVRLAFSESADLDLYVTGPREETVYYANSPSAVGGELLEDLRCEHAGPRIETVRFAQPLPGRYRVGVDYPHACGDAADVAPFVVAVETPGGRTLRRGLAALRVFEPIVLEIDVSPEETADAP